MKKLKVAVLFGGRSPEHEVSIITGIQVMNALDKNKYDVLPVYIAKDGRWVKGNATFYLPETFRNLDTAVSNKKSLLISSNPNTKGLIQEPRAVSLSKSLTSEGIDVFFPTFHGRYGEDGAVQGLFEISGIPYAGCDVETSAIGMDKVVSKRIAKSVGVPVLKDIWFNKGDWVKNRLSLLAKVIKDINLPVFVKPARLGSSIGVSKAQSQEELENALDVAFFYDTKVMIEESLENAKEVNISILGNNPYEVSVCEQPVSSGEILSFEDKYVSKSGSSKGMASSKRIIPAPIKPSTKSKIEDYAKRFFAEVGGQGIARADFLVSKDERLIYFNEINTMPGSVAFYLWKETGMSFDKLVDKLIELAIKRNDENKKLITTFKSNILEGFGGAKGLKS